MKPEEARQLLEGTTPGPWEAESMTYDEPAYPEPIVELQVTAHNGNQVAARSDFDSDAYEPSLNFDLMAAAPEMAAMIANMTTEYAVERNCSVIEGEPDWEKIGFGMHPGIIANTFWTTEKKLAEKLYKEAKTGHLPIRIVCRYVTAPQPLGEGQ